MRVTLRWLSRIRPHLPDLSDLLGLGGASALLHGIARVYAPAAWIVGGLLALAAALLLARREAKI
jgi:hypothetical protein